MKNNLLFVLNIASVIIMISSALPLQAGKMIAVKEIGRLRQDSSKVRVRLPDDKKLLEFRADKDFHYDRAKSPLTYWDLFKMWLQEKLGDIFLLSAEYNVGTIILYLIMGAALVMVVPGLINARFRSIFYRPNSINGLSLKSEITDINDLDFDALIKEKVLAGEFREAVRLLYHKQLKELSYRKMISWKQEKTNLDYIHEISKSEIREPFRELTRIFEYTWYGFFDIDNESFKLIENDFKQFDGLLT